MNQMKCSVSMTSLESPQSNLRTPEGQQKKPWPGGRQCCTLSSKKPRRTLGNKMWRRSWGSNNDDSSQEEFWRICQQSVQELVEANSDEHGLRHFLENYTGICEWLNSIQVERGRFADTVRLTQLAEDMIGKHHWRVEVNETAKNLSQKYPNLKEEFQWRLKHLNSQWDALEKILSRQQHSMESAISPANIEGQDRDLDWARNWLREKENELQPLDFRIVWTQQLLEQAIQRYKGLQAEIEEKSSDIHGVLRQCQTRGRFPTSQVANSKENSKRSRLETRWLQLRLRVLEWVQHLNGVAERQNNLKKGRRSDTYYSASNWDSDGDSNEPLRKCPKFDDGNSHQDNEVERSVPHLSTATACDEDLLSSGDLSHSTEASVEGKQEQLVRRPRSSSPLPYKAEEQQQRHYRGKRSITISNHGQLAEQVVPSPPGRLVSQQHEQKLLLTLQQPRLLQKGKEHRECQQHGVTVTLDEVDCDMGQSHDSENVFSQSEPQFPNSVVEFTFDGNQCVGMKRKLSSPSASPPLTPSSAHQYQQVEPRNISIYYFKHSDTEPEPNLQSSGNTNINNSSRGIRHQSATSTTATTSSGLTRRVSRSFCENSAIRQSHSVSKLATCTCGSGGIAGSVNSRARHHFCQKSRLFLDFDQEFEDDITSLKSYDEISFGSFDLDLDEDLEEEEAAGVVLGEQVLVEGGHPNHNQLKQRADHYSMMDLEGNICVDTSATGTASTSERELQNVSFNSSSSSNSPSRSTTAVNNNSNKPVVRLDEIDELVQKAELLVQKTTRSRGVVDCVDLPVRVGSSEDEDDETLMLPQKHCGDVHIHHCHNHYHHHQHQEMNASGALAASCCGARGSNGELARGTTNISGHGSQELLLSASSASTSFHASYSARKCSVSSSVSLSSTSAHKLGKSVKATPTTLSPLFCWSGATTSDVGGAPSAVDGEALLNCCNNNNGSAMSTNVNNGAPQGMPIVGIASSSGCNVGVGESGAAAVSSSSANKPSKKHARVRQWIRAHNSEIVVNQKNTSSCDASAESTSDSEYSSSSDSEQPVSSDDPTTVSTSTFLHQTHAALLETNAKTLSSCSSSNNISGSGTLLAYCVGAASLSPSTLKSHRSPAASSSEAGNKTLTPFSGIGPCASGTVPLRSKKRLSYGKQRPKSFTDTLEATPSVVANGPSTASPKSTWLRTSSSYFISDPAINLLGNRSNSSEASETGSGGDCACSPGNSNVDSPSHPKKKGSSRLKRRSQKGRRKTLQHDDASFADDNKQKGSILRSSSFTESASSPLAGEKASEGADHSSNTTSSPKPNFLISGPLSHQPFQRLNSDNGSVNTEELNIAGLNEQADWDSYQEKYLSEPYSEEPYDPDGTLKLLAFGEDYGQYLDRADSESSSMLSGFEPADSRKRRSLAMANRGEMVDSDSDREELNHLLGQSRSQLRFIDVVFRGLLTKSESTGETPAKYAEMEATCDENISSLKMILANIEETENLPFEIDVTSIEVILEKWHILREKIRQAANIHHIKEEMGDLKMDFSNVQSLFCTCKQFDITNMDALKEKIQSIESVLNDLPTRKLQLQHLNDASVKTQVLLEDQDAVSIIKRQLNELYVLYEDNLQLGTFLLEKMRFLQDAWEQFEMEKQEFEKSVNASNMRKLRKELSSSASTDSGHGTDFSHDSSISDSDMDFQERHKKLVALKERAKKVKAFLPPGSPVLDILDQSVEEAEKGLSSLTEPTNGSSEIIDLKSLYPRKKPLVYTRRSSGQKGQKYKLITPPPRRLNRKWTVVRRMVMFNVALMGIFLAAAYFLHPKCCEFTNTFCFSLVPHLTHESLPPI